MADFKAKITAELDTSGVKSQIQSLNNEKIKLDVDTTKLRSQIENALKKSFKITVDANTSGKNSASKVTGGNGTVGLTDSQLRQVEAYRRKSQIRTSEFEKKSNLGVQNSKLKNIDKIETAQKQSDIRIREAQRKQDIKDFARRERQLEAETRRIQREQEKIRKLTDPDSAHERVYGGTYRRTYDEYLANGSSVEKAQKAGLSAVKAQKIQEVGGALDDLTRAGARYVALPIAAATVASVKAFMDYETAFTGVRKTVNGTEEELQAISDGIEEMALRVPVASTELANLAKIGGQLGVPTKSLLKFTETFAAMEVSTNLQGEEGASTLARFMNVMHENYDNIENVGSVIVDLGNNFATTEAEIAKMGQRMGATASIIGMSTSDVLGYAAALSTMGIQAEAGGSSMSRVWQNISKAVSNGGGGLKSFAKVSKMTAKDFAKAWKDDPTKAFNAILKGLSESSDLIGDLGKLGIKNIRDITAMQDLAKRYDIVEEALKRANTAYSENTALATEAGRAYSTTASKLQIAKESIVQAGRSIGEAVAPSVIDLAGGIQSAATGFANLSDTSKKTIVNFSLLTAGTLLGANGLAKTVKTAGELSAAFIKLKGLMAGGKMATLLTGLGAATPYILGVAGAVAVAAGAVYTYKKAAEHIQKQETGVYFLEQSKKIQEYGDNVSKLTALQKELEDLQLVIKTPESSQEEIDTAKARIQEIIDMLNEEYNLKITADADNLPEVLEMLNKGETSKIIQGGYTSVTEFEKDPWFRDSNKQKYTESLGVYNDQKKRQGFLDNAVQDYESLVSQLEYATSVNDTKSISRINRQINQLNAQINKHGGLIDGFGLDYNVDYKANPKDVLEWLKDTVNSHGKRFNDTSSAISNTHEGIKDNANDFAKGMVSALSRGDKLQEQQLTDLFITYGKTMSGAGADTGHLAQQFAISKQGTTNLQKLIEDGAIDNVIKDYFEYTEKIGTSTEKATQGAALLKQGWTEASQVVDDAGKNTKKLYDDMVNLGNEKGLTNSAKNALEGTAMFSSGFNSMQELMMGGEEGLEKFLRKAKELGKSDVTGIFKELGLVDKKGNDTSLAGQADYLADIASSLDLLPENKTIAIDFKTGDVSVIDDLPDSRTIEIKAVADVEDVLSKIESAIPEGETVTYAVNAEGNIAILDEAGKAIAELKSNNEVTFKVDAEGNLQALDSAGKKLQELDQHGKKKIEIETEYKEGKIPDVEIPPETGEITYESIVMRPVIDPETGSVTYEPVVIRPIIDTETGSVLYQGTLLPFTIPTVNGGIANFILGDSPDEVGDAEGVANYTMGDHPTKAPDIFGTAYYTKVFTGGSNVDGTAHANGTAFAGGNAKRGNWGTKNDGVALGGELGEELVVRDGKFFTIGSDSAEFFAYRKGDIIFNAEQTKQIFEKGKITHGKRRGSALADGNAFAQGNAFEKGTEDPTEAIINRINLRAHELEQQESQIENDIELAEINKDSAKQASLTNDLLTTRRQRLEELASANIEISNAAESVRSANPAYDTSTWFNSQGEATEAYYALYNSANETQQESIKKLFDQLSKYKKAWADNEKEIDDIGIQIARGEKEDIPEIWEEKMDDVVSDIEHKISLRDNATGIDYQANIADYKKIQEIAHERAEAWRAAGYGDDSEEVQKWQDAWWDAQETIDELDWENSSKWIEERNNYNDWALYGDSEIEAWERVIDRLSTDYLRNLDKIKEAELNLFEARKKEFDEGAGFANTYLESQKTLLQSHFDITNSIAEARHELDKELEKSMTMYEYLDETTRNMLFNQEDYNKLCTKLNEIENEALLLKKDYEADLDGATLETIEKITSNYEMQYQTLMKSYEVAKADLEVAKKKAKLNNVLNERNVRMFVNGSWQWVANTEDVANAKAELADAEYAKQVEQAGLTQKEAIDNLTKQQNELWVVIKQFENGVINLDTAVYLAERAMSEVPSAIASMFNNAKSNSSSSYKSSSGGINYTAAQIAAMSTSQRSAAWAGASDASKQALHEANKAELSGSSTYNEATGVWTKKEYATGTRYTDGGLSLMGEAGFEAYIGSNGRLIPINQPTVGNIPSGGIVFNTDQMRNLRTLWDMSNINLGGGSFTAKNQPQQTNQTYDNRIIINGMTVDSGSSDGQALISALRRYVGNH